MSVSDFGYVRGLFRSFEGAMNCAKLRLVLLVSATLVVIGAVVVIYRPKDPNHAGRPVSAWFRDLCSGVWGGTAKAKGFDSAYAAFTEVGPEVVPYLTQQLKYDRSSIRQKMIDLLRRHSVTKAFTATVIWPSSRRSYAAVALLRIGPKAEAAIPALMETWAHDSPSVKVSAVSALESILFHQCTDGATQAEWGKLEATVIAEASRRYPSVAAELGIKSGETR